MIKKRNIYGTKELIYGSILLTRKSSGKQKYFLVGEIEDCCENRAKFIPEAFGKRHLLLASDFNISQKAASLMPNVSPKGLTLFDGYEF